MSYNSGLRVENVKQFLQKFHIPISIQNIRVTEAARRVLSFISATKMKPYIL